MNIGIDENTKLVYEGPSRLGYPVWPTPLMLQVAIVSAETDRFLPPKINDLAPLSFIFREDSYNTSSRVRRGRLYRAGDTQPVEWRVNAHPGMQSLNPQARLYTFSSVRLQPYLRAEKIERPIFLLGSDQGFTIWSLVHVETGASGEEYVTLKSRQSIGALPRLNRERILEADGKRALEFIEKFEADIYSAGPESVIDRAREAASGVVSAFLQRFHGGTPGLDLGALVSALRTNQKDVAASAAHIIARLHARGKHAEQERRELRPIQERDAQLVIECMGLILCDLGFAEW